MTFRYTYFSILSFFLLIGLSTIVYGQQSAVLVKSTMYPFKGWYGSHGGNHTISIGSKTITKSSNTSDQNEIEFDFLFIDDSENPNYINCKGSTAGNYNGDCKIGKSPDPPYNIFYDKLSFDEGYFEGCIGESEIYGIHINQTDIEPKCAEDLISLKYGWNWDYQFDSGSWIPFDSQYQDQRTISFKLKDLSGFANKSIVRFRTRYQNQITNTITYSIIGCSPELAVNPPKTDSTRCKNDPSGSVTLEFKTPLKDGDKFLFNIWNSGVPTSKFVKQIDMINNTYTWKGLAEGTYTMKYQAQSDSNNNEDVGSSVITTYTFTIGSPAALKSIFEIPKNPLCHDGNGSVTIVANGGTAPYYYILDNAKENINGQQVPKKILITNPIELSSGNYNIKVVDNNGCIEK
jgi:hypothetical protein